MVNVIVPVLLCEYKSWIWTWKISAVAQMKISWSGIV